MIPSPSKGSRRTAEVYVSSSYPSSTPSSFPSFPFPPYPIQLGFMQALYACMEHGGVGLLESPTGEHEYLPPLIVGKKEGIEHQPEGYTDLILAGTGKTMSMICSSLQWLLDHREKLKCETEKPPALPAPGQGDEDDLPDWIMEASGGGAKVKDMEGPSRALVARERLRAKAVSGAVSRPLGAGGDFRRQAQVNAVG